MKLTALAGSMVSNGRHIIIGRGGKHCAQSSPTGALNGKDQDLRPCFLSMQPRQGRSLWLPTLPFQKTNRYAVVGVTQVFYLLRLRISYTNRYEVASVMPEFVLLHLRISYTNRYEIASVMPEFVLLHPRISYTNRYAVDGITLLICVWIVMSCLLSRTLHIIKCVAYPHGYYGLFCANYRVAVDLLVGQGWEPKRPTLSKWCA